MSLLNMWVNRILVGKSRKRDDLEKLLGMTVDKNLNFNLHLKSLCKKVNQKVSELARIANILPFQKRRTIL